MKKIVLLLLTAAGPLSSFASATLENTRIIYQSDKNGKTIKISNNDSLPYVIQLWSDSGNNKSAPTDANPPFIALPPSFKMSPNSVQTVKLIYSGASLPQDRESVFYFNMVQIPPVKPNQNAMALVLKNRVKLFYRPANLSAPSPQTLENGLRFTPDGRKGVAVANASPYYVSVISAMLTCRGSSAALKTAMIPPQSSNMQWATGLIVQPGCTVNYTYINDYGGMVKASAQVQ